MARQQDAGAVSGDPVGEERQVGGVVAEDADAADVDQALHGEIHEDARAARAGVLHAEAGDQGAVGQRDGGAGAAAIHDGRHAAAEPGAEQTRQHDAAAPEADARSQDDVFHVGGRGVEDVDVARAEDGVHALLDGRVGMFGGAVAGGGAFVAVHEAHVGHQDVGVAVRAPFPSRGLGSQALVFDEVGRFEADLGVAHDHLGQAGGEVARRAVQT